MSTAKHASDAINSGIRPTKSRNCWLPSPTRSGVGTSPSSAGRSSGLFLQRLRLCWPGWFLKSSRMAFRAAALREVGLIGFYYAREKTGKS